MRTGVRNIYKVVGSEPSPYTNKVYSYMRYKNIPFNNVPGWFNTLKSKVIQYIIINDDNLTYIR